MSSKTLGERAKEAQNYARFKETVNEFLVSDNQGLMPNLRAARDQKNLDRLEELYALITRRMLSEIDRVYNENGKITQVIMYIDDLEDKDDKYEKVLIAWGVTQGIRIKISTYDVLSAMVI